MCRSSPFQLLPSKCPKPISLLTSRKACSTFHRQNATLSSVKRAVLGGALETKYLTSPLWAFLATISQ